jgi:Mlc titration factor MtfA (ptsG expression regulator)
VILRWLREHRRRRDLARYAPEARTWAEILARESALRGLDAEQRRELRELASLIMARKTFVGAAGFEVGRREATHIAALAALPVLALGLDWYRGWQTVVVYPGGFLARHEVHDDAGVVHSVEDDLAGEAWESGPVVLSWQDVLEGGAADGYNVVLHEFAHKLDMLDGASNGRPPLHSGMDGEVWAEAFAAAFADLGARVAGGEPTAVDGYAAEAPEECFAVFTEAFFECPRQLREAYPRVYRQLCLFYRQDPVQREQT